MEGESSAARQESAIEVYSNPTRPISAGVVRGIVAEFVNQVTAGSVGGQVSVMQLVLNGLITPEQVQSVGREIGERAGQQVANAQLIAIRGEVPAGGEEGEGG